MIKKSVHRMAQLRPKKEIKLFFSQQKLFKLICEIQ